MKHNPQRLADLLACDFAPVAEANKPAGLTDQWARQQCANKYGLLPAPRELARIGKLARASYAGLVTFGRLFPKAKGVA